VSAAVLVLAANLLDGFGNVLSAQNLLLAAVGVTLGTLVGVLPGIGPARSPTSPCSSAPRTTSRSPYWRSRR
jgi:hypothetical protein